MVEDGEICAACKKAPAQMEMKSLATMRLIPACLGCFHRANAKDDRPRAITTTAPPKPKAPVDRKVYPELALAGARADKIEFYLRQRPTVRGNGDDGYWLDWDSPLVPGYAGPNPYKH